ncbi:MAG: hypothetical protein K6F69_08860, partial [Treponema sp.]|nr:hypothetical protein [Treponema sp.]
AYPETNKKNLEKNFANKNNIATVIPENQSVLNFIPDDLILTDEKDWNHRTIKQSLLMFDELCPKHKSLDVNSFVCNLLRAGLQGILYMNDCLNSSKI